MLFGLFIPIFSKKAAMMKVAIVLMMIITMIHSSREKFISEMSDKNCNDILTA